MALVLQNFSAALTSVAIATSDTSITVGSTTNLPTLAAGDYFYAVITSATDLTKREIVKVTAISGTTLTVTRAQEGTTALAFPVGSLLEQRMTAKSLAEFSSNAIGSYRGYQVYSTGKTLDINDAGKYIYCNVGGTVFNLPDGSSVPAGTRFSLQAAAAATNGITVVSPTNYSGTNGTGTNSITILPGGSCDFVSSGNGWFATNGTGHCSKGANGYQAFPTGIIMQWLTTAAITAGSYAAYTFPLAFPNACLAAVISPLGISTNSNATTPSITYNATGGTVFNWGVITLSAGAKIIAIGY